MRKISFEINPLAIYGSSCFKNLGLKEKGIFHELMSLIWQSEDQFKIKADIIKISSMIECSEDEVMTLIEKLESAGDLYQELNFENMEKYIVLKCLEWQIQEFKNRKPCEIIDISKTMQSKRDSLSKRVVSAEKIIHPEIMHMKESERDLSSYQGWMPTINFASSGQVYVLPAELLSNLADNYPNINLRDELNNIFNWFAKNRDKRQPVGKISDFIYKWCDRSSVKSAVSDDSMESLLSQISVHL